MYIRCLHLHVFELLSLLFLSSTLLFWTSLTTSYYSVFSAYTPYIQPKCRQQTTEAGKPMNTTPPWQQLSSSSFSTSS